MILMIFCPSTGKQKRAIELIAQENLSVRAKFADSSPSDLYGSKQPKALKDAHRANNGAVEAAYGFSGKMTELEIVTNLLDIYHKLTNN